MRFLYNERALDGSASTWTTNPTKSAQERYTRRQFNSAEEQRLLPEHDD